MTVQSSLARASYTIASAGPYAIPFYFLADADIIAIRTPVGGGDPVTLTLTTDYTLSGAADEDGGALTLDAGAVVNGDALTIINEPAILQLTRYPETGKFPAASHERALDRLTMIAKRVYDLASRSLRLNDGYTATSLELPVSSPGKLIGWDSGGNLINTSPTAVGSGSIGTTEIADGAVTTAKIADGAVTTAKIAGLDATAGLVEQTGANAFVKRTIGTSSGNVPLWESIPLNGAISKTGAYTVVAADRGKLIDCSGTFTITLTAAATLGAGFVFGVRNSGTGIITIDPNGTETIDGAATITLGTGDTCLVLNSGTAFVTVGRDGKRTLQRRRNTQSAVTSTTALIPYDDTIPQITEGGLLFTEPFTPLSANSRIRITTGVQLRASAENIVRTIAVFRAGVADALGVSAEYADVAATGGIGFGTTTCTVDIPSPGNSAQTFEVRYGPHAASTLYVNGDTTGGRKYGGAFATFVEIEEYLP